MEKLRNNIQDENTKINFYSVLQELKKFYFSLNQWLHVKKIIFIIGIFLFLSIFIVVVFFFQYPEQIGLLISFLTLSILLFVTSVSSIIMNKKVDEKSLLIRLKLSSLSQTVQDYISEDKDFSFSDHMRAKNFSRNHFHSGGIETTKKRLDKINFILNDSNKNFFTLDDMVVDHRLKSESVSKLEFDKETLPKILRIKKGFRALTFFSIFLEYYFFIIFAIYVTIAIFLYANISGLFSSVINPETAVLVFMSLLFASWILLWSFFYLLKRNKKELLANINSLPQEIMTLFTPANKQSVFTVESLTKSEWSEMMLNVKIFMQNSSHLFDSNKNNQVSKDEPVFNTQDSKLYTKQSKTKLETQSNVISFSAEKMSAEYLKKIGQHDLNDPKLIESYKKLKELEQDLEKFMTVKFKWYWFLPLIGPVLFDQTVQKEYNTLIEKNSLIWVMIGVTDWEIEHRHRTLYFINGFISLFSLFVINLEPLYEYKIVRSKIREKVLNVLLNWPNIDFDDYKPGYGIFF